MTFLHKKASTRHTPPPGGRPTHVVPVRDVQWDRPVFRPPALPTGPLPSTAVPFTAMRALRPTRREAFEPNP